MNTVPTRDALESEVLTTMQTFVLVPGLLMCIAACSNSSNGEHAQTGAPTGSEASIYASNTSGSDTVQQDSHASSATPSAGTSGPSNASTATTEDASSGTRSSAASTAATGGTSSAIPSSTASSPPGDESETASTNDPISTSTDDAGTGEGTSGPDSSGPAVPVSNCVGAKLPSADPRSEGPFEVVADKNVGPLAGVTPDPIYGDAQQRFNVYRPANLEDSGACHPILVWANGYRDNPEQNAPDCIVDSNANRWCGQYLPLMNHLASHGFVVVASLSTATAEGDPLPTIAGLDWILEQAEDPASPYYHRLDTNNIGQLGHSYGGMSTCMSASEPRYKALATICGTRALEGVHTPLLFFCGGKDTTVECSGVRETFLSVTDQPAFFINELDADHGSWVYEGTGGVSLSASAAWFRAHLMDDPESRKFFYGADCAFCTDNRVDVEQNSLMLE